MRVGGPLTDSRIRAVCRPWTVADLPFTRTAFDWCVLHLKFIVCSIGNVVWLLALSTCVKTH